MTVLKADLAVQQSMALIRLFKQMKDYNAAGNAPDVSAGMVALATQTSLNTQDIAEIATDVRTLSNKVERNESFLQKVMTNFIDPSTFKHFLILNGQRLEADVAYIQIYGLAKKSMPLRAKTFYFRYKKTASLLWKRRSRQKAHAPQQFSSRVTETLSAISALRVVATETSRPLQNFAKA